MCCFFLSHRARKPRGINIKGCLNKGEITSRSHHAALLGAHRRSRFGRALGIMLARLLPWKGTGSTTGGLQQLIIQHLCISNLFWGRVAQRIELVVGPLHTLRFQQLWPNQMQRPPGATGQFRWRTKPLNHPRNQSSLQNMFLSSQGNQGTPKMKPDLGIVNFGRFKPYEKPESTWCIIPITELNNVM